MECHLRPVYPLSPVLFLLKLEHVLVKVELQVLIREVNTQLLKTVHSKILQAHKYVYK